MEWPSNQLCIVPTNYQYLRYSVGECKSNVLLKHLPNPLKDSNNF